MPCAKSAVEQFADDIDEIESFPDGMDDDHLPERLHLSALRLREARATPYPALTSEQLGTIASLLGMRTKVNDVVA
jgi:hypothetical protein